MNAKKYRILISITIGFFKIVSIQAQSQEIKDDTVYTSTTQQTTLYFPSSITVCNYGEESAFTRFNKRVENSMVSILAKIKNPEPAILKVTEGKRNHRFILVYKDELSANELDHDWDNLKKLDEHAKAVLSSNKNNSTSPVAATNPNPITPEPAKPGAQISSSTNPAPRPPASTPPPAPEKKKDEGYDEILLKAFTLLQNKKYVESKELYQKAVALRPDEKIATKKIADIDEILNNQQKDKEYITKIAAADQALKEKKFEEAKGLFALALSTKPSDAYATRKIAEIQVILKNVDAENKARENEAAFQKSVLAGKKAFLENRFEDAKAAFTLAAELKPTDKYSKDQIKVIDAKIQDLQRGQAALKIKIERDAAYNQALNNANEAFNNANFISAISEYKKAKLLRDDPYISDQIRKINQIIADSTQKVATEQAKIAKAKRDGEIYNQQIEKGDKAFEMKKYAEAKNSYKQALNYKEEQYAKDRIAAIEVIEAKQAEEIEIKRKYAIAVSKGKAALASNDLSKAKGYFEEAHTFQPDEAFAKTQLEAIYQKLEEIAKQRELEAKYDSCLERGAAAIAKLEYKKAQDYYKEAGQLKPQETYPTKMSVYLEGVLLGAEERAKREEVAKQRRQIIRIREDAINATIAKKWNDALEKYKEILTLNPFPTDREFALQKIIDIEPEVRKMDSLAALKSSAVAAPEVKRSKAEQKRDAIIEAARQKQEKARQDTIAAQQKRIDELKKKSNSAIAGNADPGTNFNSGTINSFYQEQAIPYEHSQLVKKYPDINFEQTPPDQTYDPVDRKNRFINFDISKKILSDTSNLNLSDSANYVKAICKSISFDGSNAFIKISIKNNSLTDFLTGAMQLKVIKKNNNSIELNQRFISDFPIILPQKEFSLVYVANAAVNVEPNDKVIMEVNDRTRKIKLRINIPGNIYNMYKTAKL